jgi:hypothetical protein
VCARCEVIRVCKRYIQLLPFEQVIRQFFNTVVGLSQDIVGLAVGFPTAPSFPSAGSPTMVPTDQSPTLQAPIFVLQPAGFSYHFS